MDVPPPNRALTRHPVVHSPARSGPYKALIEVCRIQLVRGTQNRAVMPEKGTSQRERAGRIKDARGRKVTQLDPIALYLLRQHDLIDADALRAIANEEGVRIRSGERAALLGPRLST